jgi:hypothetical protein
MARTLNEIMLEALAKQKEAEAALSVEEKARALQVALDDMSVLNQEIGLFGGMLAALGRGLLRNTPVAQRQDDLWKVLEHSLDTYAEAESLCEGITKLCRTHLLVRAGVDPQDNLAADRYLRDLSMNFVLPAPVGN